jgi:hypothetical protein
VLQTWCLALKQLLHFQQQQLLLPQQRHERQQQHRQQQQPKNLRLQQGRPKEQGRNKQEVGGFISDDDQNLTISQLKQALPVKQNSSSDHPEDKLNVNDRRHNFLALDDDLDEGDDGAVQLQDGRNEELEEDVEDWIENGDTP